MNALRYVYDVSRNKYVEHSPSIKLLFHHIPKTAGSTFRTMLMSFYCSDEICPAEVPSELEKSCKYACTSKHQLFAGHFSYSSIQEYLPDAVWITFLRNPLERVISYYYNVTDKARVPRHWIDRYNSDREWREYFETVQGLEIMPFLNCSNIKARQVTSNRQTQAFIPDELRLSVDDWSIYNKELVVIAKENLKNRFRFIGIQEYFDLSIHLFSLIFALNPINTKNYTTNLNTLKGWRARYDVADEVRKLILLKNSMDIELYEYARMLFFRQLHTVNKNLLTQNRIHLCQNHPQGQSSLVEGVRYSIEQLQTLYGFYPLEKSRAGSYRRTGKNTTATIEIYYLFKEKTRIEFEVFSPVSDKDLAKCYFMLDGERMQLHLSQRNLWNKTFSLFWSWLVRVTQKVSLRLANKIQTFFLSKGCVRTRIVASIGPGTKTLQNNYHRIQIDLPPPEASTDGTNTRTYLAITSICIKET